MPTYTFKNIETNEELEVCMKISEYDQFKLDNPHLKRTFTMAPPLKYNNHGKPDQTFRDILRNIKDKSGQGANINTFD
jgi:hypothetical protein